MLTCRIPDDSVLEFGEVKQGPLCLDTLSSTVGGGVGLYHCHGEGGNQVRMYVHMYSYTRVHTYV